MSKRLITFSIALVILLSLVTPVTAKGPQWPAFVVVPKDGWVCFMPWANSEMGYMFVYGTYQMVYHPESGSWKGSCHIQINFDDPTIASVAELCQAGPDVGQCNGNGTFTWRNWGCWADDGLYTEDSLYVVNPSGQANSECWFHPKKH
jgi:hypothetical protein